jgi:LCP family protein required for cell wall assembly
VLTATASATLGAALTLTMPMSPDIAPDQSGEPPSLGELWRRNVGYRLTRPVNVLVMGIDEVPDAPERSMAALAGRSDTMLLLRVDPTSETVSLLSIPRDTRVRIPGIGVTKINHANMEGGPELAAQVVSGALNGITIDRYIRVSTGAFRELVDLVGGVEVYVPERMYYVDRSQDLYIDLEPGQQVLNGDQAEQFARFRDDGFGDVGRVQRQQQLLQALRDRFLSPAVVPKIPEAIQLFQSYIDTNLTLEEMLALAHFGLDLERDQFRMVMLPGRFSGNDEFIASYWIMDPAGRDQVMQEYFDMGLGRSVVHSTQSFTQLRIAVQNASGEAGIAREVARYLREQGFRNIYIVQDWPDAQGETQIIVQRGDLWEAEQLEELLGTGRVVAASTGDLGSDLTIRVGADWLEQGEI